MNIYPASDLNSQFQCFINVIDTNFSQWQLLKITYGLNEKLNSFKLPKIILIYLSINSSIYPFLHPSTHILGAWKFNWNSENKSMKFLFKLLLGLNFLRFSSKFYFHLQRFEDYLFSMYIFNLSLIKKCFYLLHKTIK